MFHKHVHSLETAHRVIGLQANVITASLDLLQRGGWDGAVLVNLLAPSERGSVHNQHSRGVAKSASLNTRLLLVEWSKVILRLGHLDLILLPGAVVCHRERANASTRRRPHAWLRRRCSVQLQTCSQ